MKRKEFYIGEEQETFLSSLSDLSVSEHIRRAIDEYIDKKKLEQQGFNIATSPSTVKIRILGEEVDNA